MSPRRSLLDWAFAALLTAVSLWAFNRYNGSMDVYEKGILLCAIPAGIALGWFWGPLRGLMVGSGLAAATAMALTLGTPYTPWLRFTVLRMGS